MYKEEKGRSTTYGLFTSEAFFPTKKKEKMQRLKEIKIK